VKQSRNKIKHALEAADHLAGAIGDGVAQAQINLKRPQIDDVTEMRLGQLITDATKLTYQLQVALEEIRK
jgi:hypothetical protein